MRKEKKKASSKHKKKKSFSTTSRGRGFLFQRGNVGLARLLLALDDAGPQGISTYKLLYQLGSTHHAKAFITRAQKAGYIKRVPGQSEHGHFTPVYNIITEKGKKLLKRLE